MASPVLPSEGERRWAGKLNAAINRVWSALASHASQHAAGGSDPVTPSAIGAVSQSDLDSAVNDAVAAALASQASANVLWE